MEQLTAQAASTVGLQVKEVTTEQMTVYKNVPGMTVEEACKLARRENIIHAALAAESLADLKQGVRALALELMNVQG